MPAFAVILNIKINKINKYYIFKNYKVKFKKNNFLLIKKLYNEKDLIPL